MALHTNSTGTVTTCASKGCDNRVYGADWNCMACKRMLCGWGGCSELKQYADDNACGPCQERIDEEQRVAS